MDENGYPWNNSSAPLLAPGTFRRIILPDELAPYIDYWKDHREPEQGHLLVYWIDRLCKRNRAVARFRQYVLGD